MTDTTFTTILHQFNFAESHLGSNTYVLEVNHETNCQYSIVLHFLSDGETTRVSIMDSETWVTDLFETKEPEKIVKLIQLLTT